MHNLDDPSVLKPQIDSSLSDHPPIRFLPLIDVNAMYHQPSLPLPSTARFLMRLGCFVIAEYWLNVANLDTIADYNEFIQNQLMAQIQQSQMTLVQS
jgi:hypothetical protein